METKPTCPYCKKEVFPGDEYCLNCGKRLIAEPKAEKRPSGATGPKANKRTRSVRNVLMNVLLFAVCLILAVGLPVWTHLKKLDSYSAAKALFESGRFDEAVPAFSALDGFGDAAVLAERAQKLADKEYALQNADSLPAGDVLAALLATGGYAGISADVQTVFDRINADAYRVFSGLENTAGALMAQVLLAVPPEARAANEAYAETPLSSPAPSPEAGVTADSADAPETAGIPEEVLSAIPEPASVPTEAPTAVPTHTPAAVREATAEPVKKTASVPEITPAPVVAPSAAPTEPPLPTAVPEAAETPISVYTETPQITAAPPKAPESAAVPAVTPTAAPTVSPAALPQAGSSASPMPIAVPQYTAVPTDTPAPALIPDGILDMQYSARYDQAMDSFREGLFYTAKQQFLSLGNYRDAARMAEECVQPLPGNGELYRKSGFKKSGSAIFIVNDAGVPVVYCVYDTADTLCLMIFARPGEEVKAMLPAGRYQLHEGRGTEWYGTREYFGETGYYCIVRDAEGNRYYAIEDGYGYEFRINNDGNGEDETVSLADF